MSTLRDEERPQEQTGRPVDAGEQSCDDPAATDPDHLRLCRQIGKAEKRKLRARNRPRQSAWFGLGTFGLVGWSVAVPTVLGIALGIWLDGHYPGQVSWTLTFLFIGIVVGCLNAWYWISRERTEIESDSGPAQPPEDEPDE